MSGCYGIISRSTASRLLTVYSDTSRAMKPHFEFRTWLCQQLDAVRVLSYVNHSELADGIYKLAGVEVSGLTPISITSARIENGDLFFGLTNECWIVEWRDTISCVKSQLEHDALIVGSIVRKIDLDAFYADKIL